MKELVVYHVFDRKNVFFKKFDKTTQFISHCKLVDGNLIYVVENRHLLMENLTNNQPNPIPIYSHKSPVMALGIYNPEENNPMDPRNNNDNIILQIDDGNEKKTRKSIR